MELCQIKKKCVYVKFSDNTLKILSYTLHLIPNHSSINQILDILQVLNPCIFDGISIVYTMGLSLWQLHILID